MTVPFGKRELAIIAGLLLLAFFVRFAFFSNQGYAAIDTNDFKAWFGHAADVGVRSFYSNNYWCDYPPLNIYFFWIFGLVAKSLGVLGSNLFTYVMKLPPNLIDMATAFLIFAFVRKRLSFNWALLATALYAFNPAVIFLPGLGPSSARSCDRSRTLPASCKALSCRAGSPEVRLRNSFFNMTAQPGQTVTM